MAIRTVNAILIETADVDRMAAFYRDAVGLPLTVSDHGGGRHAEADLGGVHFAIFPGGPPPREDRAVAFSLHVDDIHAEHAKLADRGVSFEHPPQAMPFGGVLAPFRDPDGNRVMLMAWQSETDDAPG